MDFNPKIEHFNSIQTLLQTRKRSTLKRKEEEKEGKKTTTKKNKARSTSTAFHSIYK